MIPEEGTDVDNHDWQASLLSLETLSSALLQAIEQQDFDEARRLGDERLALLSHLTNAGALTRYPPELVILAQRLVAQEKSLTAQIEQAKLAMGHQLAKMATGAKANALYKKNQ